MSEFKKIGVIDVGSNSVRLMISDTVNTLEKNLITTQLSAKQINGILNQDSMKRTVKAISSHINYGLEKGVKKFYIFATEAVRSSSNKQEFCDLVKNKCGLDVHILDSQTEAKIGFLGAYTKNTCLVLDIGGASTEIAVGNNEKLIYSKSLPIGIVRIKEKVEAGENMEELIKATIKNYGKIPQADNLFAIGGSAGTIVAMEEQLEPYDSKVVHNYKLSIETIKKWEKIMSDKNTDTEKIKGLSKKRAKVILGGIVLLKNILEMLNIDYITVSENDNLEGYLQYFVNRR